MVAGAARISVSFQIDADGLLSVAAREASTGTQASVTVKPSYGLGDDAIAQMLRDAFGHAQEDAQLRRLQERKVDAQRLIEATRAALARDAELLATEERMAIEQAVDRVVRQLDDESLGSADALGVATDALARATEGFAARRMDSAVRRALTGRRVDEIAKPD
jgi:molecular chaperone HscA